MKQEMKRQKAIATIKDPDTDTNYVLEGSAATNVILQFMDPNIDAIRIYQDSTGKFIIIHKGQGCTCKLTYQYEEDEPLIVECDPIGCPDTTPPVITGKASVTYAVNAVVTPAQFLLDAEIEVTDDSGQIIKPKVDLSTVDFTTAGTYTVIVSATDDWDNTATFEVTVKVQ